MTIIEGGILILYDIADALYGPRKRKRPMTARQKLAEVERLLKRMSVTQKQRVLAAAVACGIEDF
jgi:hypothetical protein